MGLFGIKLESPNQNATKIELEKDYDFMYENFIVSSQQNLYVLLEENDGILELLNFEFKIYKYGYPNDEVGLPSKIKGIEIYGISEVHNSEWIKELKANLTDETATFMDKTRHFIVPLQDDRLQSISLIHDHGLSIPVLVSSILSPSLVLLPSKQSIPSIAPTHSMLGPVRVEFRI